MKMKSAPALVLMILFVLQSGSFSRAFSQAGNRSILVPELRINNPGKTEVNPMKLVSLGIDIKVLGQVAVTTLDMTWFNRNNRVMEGEFTFPLGEGQTVSRFAIDINGALREGVVVEKELGRKTFEAIARRNVDPGLLEMTAGSSYRSRIYPLPANGSRRIVIAYEQELTDKGGYDLYTLPLDIREKVKDFSVRVEVVQQTICLPDTGNELAGLSFKKWNQSMVSSVELKDFIPDRQIAFIIPHPAGKSDVNPSQTTESPGSFPQLPVLLPILCCLAFLTGIFFLFRYGRLGKPGAILLSLLAIMACAALIYVYAIRKDPQDIPESRPGSYRTYTATVGKESDSSWFYLTVRPEIFSRKKETPKKITVLWDNSHSARGRDLKRETELLEQYLKTIGNLTVELIPFNIRTEKPVEFVVKRGKTTALKAALESMVYDGATSLGSIGLDTLEGDEILIFSDGISNFGASEPATADKVVYTVNSGATADHHQLKFLAQRSGGMYINLNNLTNDEAIASLNGREYHFISAEVEQGSASEIYPSIPSSFRNTFSLAGIMKGGTLKIRLNFGFGSSIIHSEVIEVEAENHEDPAMLSRIWANKKIAELSLNTRQNSGQITSVGKAFGIITENTSLIVLEETEDYVRYGIVPPAELRADYFKQVREGEKKEKEQWEERIRSILALADAQTEWWNQDYNVSPDLIVPEREPSAVPAEEMEDLSDARPPSVAHPEQVPAQVMDSAGNQLVVVSNFDATVMSASYTSGSSSLAMPNGLANLSPATYSWVHNAGASPDQEPTAGIHVKAWDPQTPYLKVLRGAKKGERYRVYLRLKEKYGRMPAFYPDVSDFFRKTGDPNLSLKILSNLAELELESPQLLRILGVKLMDSEKYTEAAGVFEKVAGFKGEEPQSYRDLGLAYEAAGEYGKALKALYEVIKRSWDDRFPEIEVIALNDINAILARHPKTVHAFIDQRLIRKEPVDIRVVMTWDHDNCDMDLWVTDPLGEKCFYSNSLTAMGGKISRDFTGGYGPEEFLLKKALSGEYFVEANFYGTRSQTLLVPVNLHLTFYTHFGKRNQKSKEVTVRLENRSDVVDVGSFSFTGR